MNIEFLVSFFGKFAEHCQRMVAADDKIENLFPEGIQLGSIKISRDIFKAYYDCIGAFLRHAVNFTIKRFNQAIVFTGQRNFHISTSSNFHITTPSSGDTSIVANLQSMSVAGCHLFLDEDEEFYPRQYSANLPKNDTKNSIFIQHSTFDLRQGLERKPRKGGGRWGTGSGRATGGSYCPRP